MRFKNQRAGRKHFARQFQRFATVVALLVLTVLFVSCWLDGHGGNDGGVTVFIDAPTHPTFFIPLSCPMDATIPVAGDYAFRLIHPNGVSSSACHTIMAYQNGQLIGEAYYALVALPTDLR